MLAKTKEDKLYQARSDARTLADAELIMMDKMRVKAATTEARKMMDEVQKQVKTLSKVSRKTPRATPKKRGK